MAMRAQGIHPNVGIAGMAPDGFVLLEPGQWIPLESHQSGNGSVAVVEDARRFFVGLSVANQRESPRRAELHLLRMVFVAQELGSHVCERDVVLRVVRDLPHVSRGRR